MTRKSDEKQFRAGYEKAVQDVLKTIWFDTYTSQQPDAQYVLSRLEFRIKALLDD